MNIIIYIIYIIYYFMLYVTLAANPPPPPSQSVTPGQPPLSPLERYVIVERLPSLSSKIDAYRIKLLTDSKA